LPSRRPRKVPWLASFDVAVLPTSSPNFVAVDFKSLWKIHKALSATRIQGFRIGRVYSRQDLARAVAVSGLFALASHDGSSSPSPTVLPPKPSLAVIQRSALRDEGSPSCPAANCEAPMPRGRVSPPPIQRNPPKSRLPRRRRIKPKNRQRRQHDKHNNRSAT
jgi:hypothetical protein